jgi:hypothetical protein
MSGFACASSPFFSAFLPRLFPPFFPGMLVERMRNQ